MKNFISIKCRPLSLMLAGLLLFSAGFVYDALFAGMPYQDPTPALEASYAFHAHIANVLNWLGAMLFALGALAGIMRWLLKRFSAKP